MKAIKLIRTAALAITLAGLSVGAVQAGDDAKAAEFTAAVDAYRQGELGYKQAMSQKDAAFPSYMR